MEDQGTANLPPTSTSTITAAISAFTTIENVSSSGSVASTTSYASASTTSIGGSRSDHSEGGKSLSSSSCSSGLGSVWGLEDVIEDMGPKGAARSSDGDDSEEEEGFGEDELDSGASVSTAGSTDDGCLDAFLVDTDSGSDNGEGMSDVSSISSHGLSHGSGVSRNVAINTAFNKGRHQRRSVQDPLFHISPILIPSTAPPSSPMQTTPSTPDRTGTGKGSASNSPRVPFSIAINASMAIEPTDLQSPTNNHRDDGESGSGIVLVGLGEEVLQDLRGSFKGREANKSPSKRVW